MSSPRTIALVGKYHSPEIAESLRRLAEYLHERGVSVFIERETAEHIGKKVDLSRWVTNVLGKQRTGNQRAGGPQARHFGSAPSQRRRPGIDDNVFRENLYMTTKQTLSFQAEVAQLLHLAAPAMPVHTPLLYVILAECVAITIGLAAGVLPARRAARLDPVEALRTE